MKTFYCAVYIALSGTSAHTFLMALQLLKKIRRVVFFSVSLLVSHFTLTAQDIPIQNPSMEGIVKQRGLPPYWINISQSPDTQPGWYDISLAPSDGKTYVGGIYRENWEEGVGQKLSAPLQGGKRYTMSFDLAYTAAYIYPICAGAVAVYGENTAGDKAELLWQSGAFYNTAWQRDTAVFAPSRNYEYISFYGAPVEKCGTKKFTAYLIDNLSAFIYEVPQFEMSLRNTCSHTAKGTANVVIKGGVPPFHYSWSIGQHAGDTVGNLDEGSYEVTVTGANNVALTKKFMIGVTDVQWGVVVKPPDCYGDHNATITLAMKEGYPPGEYMLKNSGVQRDPVFGGLKAGKYNFMITDARGCSTAIEELSIPQPDPLSFDAVTKDVSCSDTRDGKISLDVKGGTAPYTFRMETGTWQPENGWQQLDAGRYYYEVKDNHECQVKGASDIIKNIRECAVFVPTAFSPNGDGQNDLFRVKLHDDVHDFRLDIFSRWGQQVFSTTNPEGAWNGELRGKQQAAATYIWVLTYTDSRQQARKQTGVVTLIR